MGTWDKLAVGKINIWGKWAPGKMDTKANGHLEKMDIWGKGVGYHKFPKGVPQVPCVHFPKCLHMATMANEHLDVWGKGVP